MTWNFLTSPLLSRTDNNYVGDLSRIGYQIPSLQLRKTVVNLNKEHINLSDWNGEVIDMITIGDSFSSGGGKGKNSYYQDYIASIYNLNVLNVPQQNQLNHYIETIIAWKNNGFLELVKPGAILLQTGGRLALGEFSRTPDWNFEFNLPEIYSQLPVTKPNIPLKQTQGTVAPVNSLYQSIYKFLAGKFQPITQNTLENEESSKISFINTANYNALLYNFLYQFSPTALGQSSVYRLDLHQPLFSADADKTLLIYDHDISKMKPVNLEKVMQMNSNLNRLAKLLKEQEIDLIFMLIVDKYDLYFPYITNNPFSENRLFELLRPLHKDYFFIDTKAILSPMLDDGEKDLFFSDDTHWSFKASKAIVKKTPFPDIVLQNTTISGGSVQR